MPVSGEMRLRQLILALIALAGIWVGVVMQRSHHGHARAAFAVGPAPPDFLAPPAKPKLVHIKGLSRPASATPIAVKVTPRPYVHAPGGVAPKATRHVHRLHAKPKPAEQPTGIEAAADDSRNYAETPPPPLDPLQITNVQVSALTSSSARITWETNIPTL